MPQIKIYTDGGARGNPGPAAIGIVIIDEQGGTLEQSAFIGDATNNIAEHMAIQSAFKYLCSRNYEGYVINCFLDANLVVQQLNGKFKIKDIKLKQIAIETFKYLGLLNKANEIKITHIYREANSLADKLVNKVLDSQLKRLK